MIPDEVGVVGLAFLGPSISVEANDGHSVGVQAPQRNVFLFQGIVSGLLTLISAHDFNLRYVSLQCFTVIKNGYRGVNPIHG